MESKKQVLQSLFEYIDGRQDDFIDDLRDVVCIPSVSALPSHRDHVQQMMQSMADQLAELGVDVEMCDIGKQKLPDGSEIDLPEVILGTLGDDPSKPTLLVYGHLDVQPANKSDGWDTEPFTMAVKNGTMYGRGTTDDKGPVLGWLHVVEAYRNTNNPLPVNLKFCFEGMEECGSEGLDSLLYKKQSTFLSDVDYVCISDCYWLGTRKPCLIYSLRGVCAFSLEIKCADRDLHSGVYGGSINEAMSDLVALLNSLVDHEGKILVPGVLDDVQPLSEEEFKLYQRMDFDVSAYKQEIGNYHLLQSTKEEVLMARWRYPSLSIHGIEGAYAGPGMKCIIPHTVIGKFSIRLVADQDPKKVCRKIEMYLQKQLAARDSANKMELHVGVSIPAWRTDPKHPHFEAAARAVRAVYEVEPDFTRGEGTIPVTLTLANITGKNVLLLPMGRGDDGAHSTNEKLDIDNYIEGTKVMAAYFYEVGEIGKCTSESRDIEPKVDTLEYW